MVIKGPGIRSTPQNNPPQRKPGVPRAVPVNPRPKRLSSTSDKKPEEQMKLCMEELAGKPCVPPFQEWALNNTHINIGRLDDNDIRLTHDPEASRKHCIISDGYIRDNGSFNGTFVNGMRLNKEKVLLKPRDQVKVGLSLFVVRIGTVDRDELSKTKQFPGLSTLEVQEQLAEDARVQGLSVEKLMEEEFAKVVGHDNIKKQLRRFYKKVQLDAIREANGRLKDKQGAYHMIFQGPPGTGKTSMANLVAKVMVKMGLVRTNKVVFVNNALDLLAGYAGQTSGKVDAKVQEAAGGVLFVDEAYSIVQQDSKESFGREAIDTIMKHLDPPSCVFILAGYAEPMNDFLRVNEGLGRRIPFRYDFHPYTVPQLVQIAAVMCEAKGERLEAGVLQQLPALLEAVDVEARETHNAGLISNLVSFAQLARDSRVDLCAAERDPLLACTLAWRDFESAMPHIRAQIMKK